MAIDRSRIVEQLRALQSDLAAWAETVADFTVLDAIDRSVVLGGPMTRELGARAEGFPSVGLIVAVAGSTRHADDGDDPMDAVVSIAAYLQDEMIDLLGRGWPELTRNGRFVSILTPRLLAGRPVWSDPSGTALGFGELAGLRGRRIV
jgi:hypothetical protein